MSRQPASKKEKPNKPRHPHESLSLQDMLEQLKHADFSGHDFSQSLRRLDNLIQMISRQDPHQLNRFVIQSVLNFTHQYMLRKIPSLTRDVAYREYKSRGKGGNTQPVPGTFSEALPKLLELIEQVSVIDAKMASTGQKIVSRKKKELEIQLLQQRLDQLRLKATAVPINEPVQSPANAELRLAPEFEAELANNDLPPHLAYERMMSHIPMPVINWHTDENTDSASMGKPPLKNAASA